MALLRRLFTLFICLLLLALSRPAAAGEPEALVTKSLAVFKSFMADPNMDWFRKNVAKARGILIIPQMLRGGFFVGGSGGSGVLFAQYSEGNGWSYPAFYTIGSISFGLQIGADASELILMIMTDKGMDGLLSPEFKLGGDVAVAAGPIGMNAKAQTADVLAFGRSKGVFGGIAIEGAVISPRNDWNSAYYGKPVRSSDILILHSVTNPQADPLRAILPQRQRNVQKLH